ncbi:TPA: hypothetical protein ACIO9G_004481, partial [Salmonella enterica subsp. enterica serovar 1,4,5,12:b:-]
DRVLIQSLIELKHLARKLDHILFLLPSHSCQPQPLVLIDLPPSLVENLRSRLIFDNSSGVAHLDGILGTPASLAAYRRLLSKLNTESLCAP